MNSDKIHRLASARLTNHSTQSLSSTLSTFKVSEEMQSAPPVVTAYAWAVHDGKTGDLLWGKYTNDKLEMASLTKIMTLYVAVKLIKRFSINPETYMLVTTRPAAYINGTHSGLREGDQISLKDAFYGMMLPSGNDAALLIAHYFGLLLQYYSKKGSSQSDTSASPVKDFVKEMNKYAFQNALRNTCFVNPHGLSEKGNRSTVSDLGKLGFLAMQEPLFASVVNTQMHSATITDRNGNLRIMTWQNTNKLLEEDGFSGIKTGNTPNAGPCLSICYQNEEEAFIITLLNCRSPEHRWTEANKLAFWSKNKMQSVRQHFMQKNSKSSSKLRSRVIAGLLKY